jgi:hypothetical protein
VRFRTAAFFAALPLASHVQAQSLMGPILSGIRTLQEKQLLPLPEQVNPTQPSGNPLPPVQRTGDLPMAGPLGPEGGAFHLIYAGSIEQEGQLVHGTGGVEFTARGYHCWADEVYGDRSTDIYTLKGHVRVEGADKSIYGDTVQVNFPARTFVAEDASSTLKPELIQGRLRDNLYVKAHRSFGSQREVFGENVSATTCSYPEPHYEIVAEKTDVRPGRRVIFRKVKLKLLGHTVLNLPFLSVPLDERTYNNLPQVGRGSQEGYFIKTRWGIPLGSSDDSFDSRVDYFTKLGVGLGGDYKYASLLNRGVLRVYTIQGPHNQFEITSQHRQDFKWANFTFDGSYQNNNYLISSSSKILNSRAVLNIPQGLSSSQLRFTRATADSPGSNTSQQTLAVNDNRTWQQKRLANGRLIDRLRTTLDVNLSSNTSSFTGGLPVHRDQLDVNFRAVSDLEKAQAQFDYRRSIPIGESTNFFTTSDVTPSLTFMSDSGRLFGEAAERRFPFRAQLGFGEYGDPITRGRLTRTDLELGFRNPNSWADSRRRLSILYQANYKQDLYSNDTAQYVLKAATQIAYRFGDRSVFNLRYNYIRPYGFTPLQIDRSGNSHNVLGDVSYLAFRRLSLGVGTGYDFNLVKQHAPTPWQQVNLNARYTLGRSFEARALSTYDTTRHAFSSTRLDMTWIPGSTFVSFGAKYDGIRNKWAAANLFVDGFKIGRLRTSMLFNYNGYTRKFDAQHYSFIYDLHCAEAVLQVIDNSAGFNSGRQVFFFIRLKALPFDTPFGTGSQGQPIGTGTGHG